MRTTIKETLNPDGTVAVRETTYEEESVKDKLDELIAETRRLADRDRPAQLPVWVAPEITFSTDTLPTPTFVGAGSHPAPGAR